MSNAGSSPPMSEGLQRSRRQGARSAVERQMIQRRRSLVGQLRFVEQLTEEEIVARLLKETPPIHATQPQVSRDLTLLRQDFRRYFNGRAFDAASEVAIRLARFERKDRILMKAIIGFETQDGEKDRGVLARLVRASNETARHYTDLLQDVGLLDRRLGTLFIGDDDPAKKRERVQSGEELAKIFESIDVGAIEGELVPEAEKAWLYGDMGLAQTAANEAKTPVQEKPDESK